MTPNIELLIQKELTYPLFVNNLNNFNILKKIFDNFVGFYIGLIARIIRQRKTQQPHGKQSQYHRNFGFAGTAKGTH